MSNRKTQKRNIKSKITFIALIMMLISVFSINVYAAPVSSLPDSFTATDNIDAEHINRFAFIKIGNEPVGFAADIVATVNGTTYQLYCLEHDKTFPNTGRSYSKNTTNNDEYIDDGIIYILTNGYDQNSSFMADFNFDSSMTADQKNDAKKYVTQMAIWYYQGIRDNGADYAGSSDNGKYLSSDWITAIKNNTTYGAEIIKLATDALTANNNPNSIGVDESSIKEMTKKDNYYETDYIVPVYTGDLQSYTVTIPTNTYNAMVIDEDGKEVAAGSSIPAGKKFKIRVAADKVKSASLIEIKDVTITGTFTVKSAYSYLPDDASYQTILYAAYTTESKNTATNFKIVNTPKTPTPNTATDIPWYVYIVGAMAVIVGLVTMIANSTHEQKTEA